MKKSVFEAFHVVLQKEISSQIKIVKSATESESYDSSVSPRNLTRLHRKFLVQLIIDT